METNSKESKTVLCLLTWKERDISATKLNSMEMKLRCDLRVQYSAPTNRLSTVWTKVRLGSKSRQKLRHKLDPQLMLKVECTAKMLRLSTVMINLKSSPKVLNSSKTLQLSSVLMHQLKVRDLLRLIRLKEEPTRMPRVRAILTSKDYINM